ncbi:MAG: adenylyltransferase/cytidyltransferase family protein, partial [Eggerthella lenta]
METVYVGISSDILHEGVLNVIKKASELGEVTVGLISDEVVAAYKRVPLLDFKARKRVYENVKGVSRVVEQATLSYR